MASTRRGSQAETMSCHRARVRIASSTRATSRYSKFTLPRAMGRGTHLCFPDAGMLHKFHVALAYLRNSAATRALWQNQPCHKLLPSGLKLHQKNDDMEARLPNIKQHQCQRRFLFSFPKKHKAMRPLEAHPSAGAGASSIGDGRRRVNLVLNIASRPWRRRVNLVPRTLTTLTAPNKLLPSGLKLHQKNGGMEARRCHNSATVGAPPRLPTELFVRLRITPARGRGDKQEVLMGR